MSTFQFLPLDEYKTRASILLKNLRSEDVSKVKEAAERFRILPFFNPLKDDEVAQAAVKHKHALTVLALENGFDTWADMKRNIEYNDKRIAFKNRNYTSLCPKRCWGIINEWHTRYADALAALKETGGYLLPYKNQFFVCQARYIEALGLEPDDIDWELIEWNWVKPANSEAWERLNEKLEKLDIH